MRSLLSIVAKIYDPLGLASPFTNTARMVISDCFRNKLTFTDDLKQLPQQHHSTYLKWIDDITNLDNVAINRHIPNDEQSDYYFYSDASDIGLCAVAYCRKKNADGTIDSNLMFYS